MMIFIQHINTIYININQQLYFIICNIYFVEQIIVLVNSY